jgi:competence protein ComEA
MKRKLYLLVLLVVVVTCLGCKKDGSSEQLLELDLLEESEGEGEGESAKDSPEELEEQVIHAPIFVHVCGAVKEPGVYELTGNKRVFEAVDLAGGLSEDAALSYINLARVVEDGERLYVPNLEEIARLKDGGLDINLFLEGALNSGSNNPLESSGKVNINQAGLDELMTLSGIGPSKARSIMDYREQQGGFSTIEELMNVSGIGASTFEKIRDSVIL